MPDVRRLIDEGSLDEAARHLEEAPDTRLMLRLAAALQDRGRHDDALGWYHRILDPFYFGGCNSSCDAFALAAPVVTLPGFLLPGRFTLGRTTSWTSRTASRAQRMNSSTSRCGSGKDPAYREEIARRIAKNSERLFDRPDCGRALGAALLRIAEERG